LSIFIRSRTIVWLLLLGAVASVRGNPSVTVTQVGRLEPAGSVGHGIAIAVGGWNDVFVVCGPAPRLLIWDRDGKFTGEFSFSDRSDVSPVDITPDAGFSALAVDPFAPEIFGFSRRGEPATPTRLTPTPPLEPISVLCDDAGRTIVLDRRAGDLWRIERDGGVSPLSTTLQSGLTAHTGIRIEWDAQRNLIWELTAFDIRAFTTGGKIKRTFKCPLDEPDGLALLPEAVIVVGKGIALLSPDNGETLLSYSADSLAAWGVEYPEDVAARGDKIYILSTDGKVIVLKATFSADGQK
jgi:hypothetical protein